ncbi:MAG: class I SAM-dependent methyltransferase [Chloroflexota bacterium]|nr:class I SAM-dependent methyltransferase [Chloroflexota bacterium]
MPSATKARDWQPVRKALAVHVRQPLLSDPETATVWAATPITQIGSSLGNQGQINANTDPTTILWYTLAYTCMHFDALTTLMHRAEFKHDTLDQLPPSPHVLHIDLGCGPGTASWAVASALPDDATLRTAGHDHNPHMVALARAMTSTVSEVHQANLHFRFDSELQDLVGATLPWQGEPFDIVIVTINSLFGQHSFNINHVQRACSIVREIRSSFSNIPISLLGTHPIYSKEFVDSSWMTIAGTISAKISLSKEIAVQSWSPIKIDADQPSMWHPWNRDHLGHILQASPLGGE